MPPSQLGGTAMDGYPPIAEHGLIGDLQTAALVTTDGTVDWFCCPRFDSPSVFASLLDHDDGGRFRITAEGDDCVTRQLYFPDTAVLITRFMTPDGVGEVIDFIPVDHPNQATDRHRLVRTIRVVRGVMGTARTSPRHSSVAVGGAVSTSRYDTRPCIFSTAAR